MTASVDPVQGRPWRILALVLAGLLVAVAVASIAAVLLTRSVGDVADRALRSDIALEDEAEDVLIAVLALRQYQRTLSYAGPTRSALTDFDTAYQDLLTELDELAAVDIDPSITRTDELLALATAYHEDFRPAMDLFTSDPDAFDAANDQGLIDLAALQDRAEELDRLGEARSTAALGNVESATATATAVMLLILVGVTVAGVALTFVAWRVLRELRSLAASQQQTADQLRDALRARNDLIADASHELRTPLTVLRGNAEVGLAMGPSDCAHEPILREIVSESERMTRLVEDLLFLARSDAGAAPLEPLDVDLEPWLADVAARAEVLCRGRHVAFAPHLAVVGRARLDAERMAQALMIVVDNAARFSPSGAPVTLSGTLERDALVLVTTDEGPGIPADLLPHVFDRFRRGDPARGRRSTGAGLGLAIALAIVEGHGGTIEAGTPPGGGTRMTIRVPLTGPPPAEGPPA
jgi:signal transduction histidine kinase